MSKRLYLLKQDINRDWDTYDSMIVCATSEDEARLMHPSEYRETLEDIDYFDSWVPLSKADKIEITVIGYAEKDVEIGVVLASFNAG